jgi:fatty acyl-CoA reductase
MGKVFIERLLRLTEFEKIYILIRPKKGVQPEERLRELFKDMVEYLKVKKRNWK